VVGCVAVLSVQKGLTYLLQAAREIIATFPTVRFLIVGGGTIETALRAEAAALGLGSRVVFTGWRQDYLEILQALDIFVMSSLWEAMPMALLEAMAARRAIIVTDVGDNRQIIDDGRCGILVAARDAGAIARAIRNLVEHPRSSSELSERAYRRFKDHYTVSHMVSQYERLYAAGDRRSRGTGAEP
jgi:glycosyltransferase involved in cell wall biosynthesis